MIYYNNMIKSEELNNTIVPQVKKRIIKQKKKYAKRQTSRVPVRWQGDENEKLIIQITYNREYIKNKLVNKTSMKNLPKIAQEYFCNPEAPRKLDVIRVHFHKMLPFYEDGKQNLREEGTMLGKIQELVKDILNMRDPDMPQPAENNRDRVQMPSYEQEGRIMDMLSLEFKYYDQQRAEAIYDREKKGTIKDDQIEENNGFSSTQLDNIDHEGKIQNETNPMSYENQMENIENNVNSYEAENLNLDMKKIPIEEVCSQIRIQVADPGLISYTELFQAEMYLQELSNESLVEIDMIKDFMKYKGLDEESKDIVKTKYQSIGEAIMCEFNHIYKTLSNTWLLKTELQKKNKNASSHLSDNA